MSSLFTRMFRGARTEPLSAGQAVASLVDTGHRIAELEAENARLRAALERHGIDAPKRLHVLREHGWLFTYSPATRYIGAEHTRGGQQSIAGMSCWDVHDSHEIGAFIAAALNGR